jgi:hypothetical protein
MTDAKPPGWDRAAAETGTSAANPVTTNGRRSSRVDWGHVLDVAAEIVDSYDTLVTLRQLFYRLLAATLIANTDSHYKRLSELTAAARRTGDFPTLFDGTRGIESYRWFGSPAAALNWTASIYRTDRTSGQDVSIYLGVEKAGLVNQLMGWFTDPLGIPVLPLRGYSSEPFESQVIRHVERQDRPAILVYAGDFDASGTDIDRNFIAQTDCWHKVIRVALNPQQITEHGLVRQRGKHKDSRVRTFVEKYGDVAVYDPANPYITDQGKRYLSPVQVELDALDPNTLRTLFADAVEPFWDESLAADIRAEETAERDRLRELARRWEE